MGQSSHGAFRAFPSHVLRYGLRTNNGRTLGVSVDALATAASARKSNLIFGEEWFSQYSLSRCHIIDFASDSRSDQDSENTRSRAL